MKYFSRSNMYKASNVTFSPETISAYSYGWWKFVGIVEGKVIFNNHRYSNSTSGHQQKTRSLLKELGIKIDIELPLISGLPGSYLRYGQTSSYSTLAECIYEAECELCNDFLNKKLRDQERYYKNKAKKQEVKKLEAMGFKVKRDYRGRVRTSYDGTVQCKPLETISVVETAETAETAEATETPSTIKVANSQPIQFNKLKLV